MRHSRTFLERGRTRFATSMRWLPLAAIVASSTAVSCGPADELVAPRPPANAARSSLVGQPVDTAKLSRFREIGEGCAVGAADPAGILRGFAMPRNTLPFVVPPIQTNPSSHRGNGRVVRMVITRSVGTPITFTCWLPKTLTIQEFSALVRGSDKNERWQSLLSNLASASQLPPAGQRSTVSPEAAAFESEMIEPDSTTLEGPHFAGRANGHDASVADGSHALNLDCDEYATGRGPRRPAPTPGPVHGQSGTCSCYEWNATIWYDGSSWHFSVSFSFCGGGGGGDYGWMIDNNYWAWPCGGVEADQRDKMRQQYIDSTLAQTPGCSDFSWQSSSAHFSWSVVQSHALETAYDPYFAYGIYRSTLSSGLETLYADTAFTLTTSNRIYSTPHHNYTLPTHAKNSRHVYGDAADIQSKFDDPVSSNDSLRWNGLRSHAKNLSPRPCAEPYAWSRTHLHIDYRAASGALAGVTSCPSTLTIP